MTTDPNLQSMQMVGPELEEEQGTVRAKFVAAADVADGIDGLRKLNHHGMERRMDGVYGQWVRGDGREDVTP